MMSVETSTGGAFTSSINHGQVLSLEDKMKYEAFRLQTYEHWQFHENARPILLAKYGFFYNNESDGGDTVTCYSCGVQKRQWSYRSNPEVEHRRLNSNCLHIRGQDIQNVPITVPTNDIIDRIWSELHSTYCSDNQPSLNMTANFSSSVNNNHGNYNVTTKHPSMPLQLNVWSPISSSSPSYVNVECKTDSRNTVPFSTNYSSGRAVKEKLYSEAERLKTFEGVWKKNTPTPIQLANSGFVYTGIADRVECVFCNGILRNWNSFDIPIEEHRKHFPGCPFISNYNVGNIPIQRDSVDPVLQAIRQGIPGPVETVDVSQNRGASNITDPNLINKIDLPSSIGIHTERPRHPEFATEASRVESFKNWPSGISQTPQQLAKAGFFYAGFDDSVKCFFCDGGLRTWDPEDDPWTEHARWFTRCSYVLQVKGEAFVQQFRQTQSTSASIGQTEEREVLARMDLPAVQSVLGMDIPRDRVMAVIREQLQKAGDDFKTVEDLLNAIYQSGEQQSSQQLSTPEEENKWSSKVPVPTTPAAKQAMTCRREILELKDGSFISGDSDSNADHASLLEENQRLKEQRNCKICMDEEANIVLLPCGHLVSCATCAPALRKCPICRATIKGTVRTYIS